jgi:NAD(P)-dependent dehydrogenase (short-subunit alcohol dehydrogenase family)
VAPSASRTAATSGLAAGAARRALAARYLVIARSGNERLEDDFDPLEDRDRDHLVRSRADLRDAAATERLFDRRLLAIAFPSQTERVVRELYRVNQARAALTVTAAASTPLSALHAYDKQLDDANGPVEQAVRTIRRKLGLPPPDTS